MKKYDSRQAKARVMKKTVRKMFHIPPLRVLRADLHHLLRVAMDAFSALVQLDVRLDELDRPVGAGGDRLDGGAGEPVDDGAAGDEPRRKGRVQDGEELHVRLQPVGEHQ